MLRDVLDIHERGGARDSDRFLDGADAQLRVERQGHAGRQLQTLAPHGAEARQRERYDIGARTQVDDPVDSLAVRERRSDFFDQCRARRFDRDARQNPARRISYDATDGSGLNLAGGCDWQQHDRGEGEKRSAQSTTCPHGVLLR